MPSINAGPRLDRLPISRFHRRVFALVRKELLNYLTKGLLPGFAPASGSSSKLSSDEQKFIEQIARDAVGTPGTNMSVFQEAALLHIRLSLNTTETLNALASELDVPGIKNRNFALRDLEQRIKTSLKTYALPGRPFTGFGYRRGEAPREEKA